MDILKEKIVTDGKVYPGNVLKVNSFLNHLIDVKLVTEMGKEFKRLYNDCEVTKILTIEASGIGLACVTAQFFDCPVLFAKKESTSNLSSNVYRTGIHSYTHGNDYQATIEKDFLKAEDKVLIIDDFLASGEALNGLIDLCAQASAEVVGCGIAIEKSFQPGGKELRAKGVRVESLAMVSSMENGKIEFDN
ncbi:MAG: xanthine phosphoribosyltransferase [Clostridia bacterium]|nr:xanthine phosphoribosyltransferase [Clostridia bacterium]